MNNATKTTRPFSGPSYAANARLAKTDSTCVHCGRAVAEPWVLAAHVVSGGDAYAGQDADGGAGYMGCFPRWPGVRQSAARGGRYRVPLGSVKLSLDVL
jgi:hypothetical protein